MLSSSSEDEISFETNSLNTSSTEISSRLARLFLFLLLSLLLVVNIISDDSSAIPRVFRICLTD